MLNYGAYENWIQSRLVQAQYWHDPLVSNKIIFWGSYGVFRKTIIEIVSYFILRMKTPIENTVNFFLV